MPSTIHSRNTTALVCLLAHKAFVKAKCFAHATRYEGECNELVLPDIRGQHICFGSYGKLQDCPLRHLFSCVFVFANRRRQIRNRHRKQTQATDRNRRRRKRNRSRQSRNRHRYRYRQSSQKEWDKQDFVAMLSTRRHKTDDVHAHTRPHAHAQCKEVLHPSITSFSHLLHDAFKVHFTHEAF